MSSSPTPPPLRLGNLRNGLAFPHDRVCAFLSTWGHTCKIGYFRIDSMPYDAVIHLLQGGSVTVVDATRRHKAMTDAQRFGVTTWCMVFNRAIGCRHWKVADHETPDMRRVAMSDLHSPCVGIIRKLFKVYGAKRPAVIGENVLLECHQGFIADDNVRRLQDAILGQAARAGEGR